MNRSLTWIGGPTFTMETGSFRLLTDPVLGEGAAVFTMHLHPLTGQPNAQIGRVAPLPACSLDGLDLVLISHMHTDHFDAAAARSLPKETLIIAPISQVAELTAQGFTNARGLGWWQEFRLTRGGERLAIQAVPARHAVSDGVNEKLGTVNGYLIEHQAGGSTFRTYWTGDTVWFQDLPRVKELAGEVDLLIPHMGAVGKGGPFGRLTLDAEEAARLVRLFAPRTVLPVHHHTFTHYQEDVNLLRPALDAAGYAGELAVLAEGERWAASMG